MSLKFNELFRVDQIIRIDLWNYAEIFNDELPTKTGRGMSAICVTKKDTRELKRNMDSHIRRIMAVGTLSEPFCVYIR